SLATPPARRAGRRRATSIKHWCPAFSRPARAPTPRSVSPTAAARPGPRPPIGWAAPVRRTPPLAGAAPSSPSAAMSPTGRARASGSRVPPARPAGVPPLVGGVDRGGGGRLGPPGAKRDGAVLPRIDGGGAGPPARFLGEVAPPPVMSPGQALDLTLTFGNCS